MSCFLAPKASIGRPGRCRNSDLEGWIDDGDPRSKVRELSRPIVRGRMDSWHLHSARLSNLEDRRFLLSMEELESARRPEAHRSFQWEGRGFEQRMKRYTRVLTPCFVAPSSSSF